MNSTIDYDLANTPDLTARLAILLEHAVGPVVLTTSFGLEDQVLTHAAVEAMAATGRQVSFATLDTGRLFAETHDVWAATEARYGLRIESLAPDATALRHLVASQGPMGFRETIDNRKACCATRKLDPLRGFLEGAGLWITGLRADQSQSRTAIAFTMHDPVFGVLKAQPLADWSRADVAAYADAHNVPRNVLHARGYLSIGCAPCTRAVAPGEPERAGRWWWENEAHKECGLHQRQPETV